MTYFGETKQFLIRGNDLKAAIQEELTPLYFAHPDVVINLEIHKRIRRFLDTRQVQLVQTAISERLIPRRIIVARFFDSDQEECRRALSIYDAAKRGEDVTSSPRGAANTNERPFFHSAENPATPRITLQQEGIKAKQSKVFAANLRHISDRFSGALDENCPHFLARYQQVCSEAEVKAGDKILFLRHAFRDEALEFYYSQILYRQENWGTAVAVFNETYSSEAKMDAVTEKLKLVSISDYETTERTAREALKEINK